MVWCLGLDHLGILSGKWKFDPYPFTLDASVVGRRSTFDFRFD